MTAPDKPGLSNEEFIAKYRKEISRLHVAEDDTDVQTFIEALDRLESATKAPVAQVEVYRKALESALKAFECVKANDKTVYNYKGDGAKNRDGLTLEEGRWATPLEIATDEMKLIQALLTSKPEPVAKICPDCRGLCGKADKKVETFTPCKTCGGNGSIPVPVAPVRKWRADDVK